jgi:cation:H+ antiporter
VPPIVVAITVVALGTSLPELVVSIQAVFTGYPGIVLGNVVGSNIANVFLVAGVSAIVFPLAYPGGSIRRDTAVMIGVSILFLLLCMRDALTRTAGAALLAGLALVLVPTIRDAAKAKRYAAGQPRPVSAMGLPTRRRLITLFIVLGIIGLPVGAGLVVEGTVRIALSLGVSEAVVGLSIVAFATSLPELATTVVAAYKKETDVAIGTIVGSNVFNILAIMGVAALASPRQIHIPRGFLSLDLPFMLLAAFSLSVFAFLKKPVSRGIGVLFTVLYVVYIGLLFGVT